MQKLLISVKKVAMINVWIPYQAGFERFRTECKELYLSSKSKIKDDSSFEFVLNNTFFYLFEKDGILIGGIYYFKGIDSKLYLNGFAKRKMHELCLNCLKMSLNWFRGRVYAEAQNRASALCLLRCGFKREKGKLFVKNLP